MWIVVDIGCIECGESSDLVGIFSTEEKANSVCSQLNNSRATFTRSQHEFDVFELGLPNKINPDYLEYLSVIDGEIVPETPLIEGN